MILRRVVERLRVPTAALALGLVVFLCAVTPLYAQRALSVTVTPPLIQLTIGPGETWSSTVKIVNDNPYEVSYYATIMDFAAEGEEGQPRFVPLVAETGDPTRGTFSLASWLTIDRGPYTIPGGASMEIPFTVRVPQNAEPGGHYASILIGTQPADEVGIGATMKISSYVSSLLFVKIKGDIVEKGRIREFRTENTLYETPSAHFLLRFENLGNTHLKPQGNVTIYNMWGKERGSIDVNGKTNFGNVLPQSIRKFTFAWEGEGSVFDVGRYSAVVTLGFGQDSKQNVTAVTYFWVVPTVPMITTIGIIIVFGLLISWLIRRYIRRALELEKMRVGYALHEAPQILGAEVPAPRSMPAREEVVAPSYTMQTLIEPLKEGVIDLRRIGGVVTTPVVPTSEAPIEEARMSVGEFVRKYYLFFVFVVALGIAGALTWWYLTRAMVPNRGFQITDVQVHEEQIETPKPASQI